MPRQPKDDYEVGRGRPPKNYQYKKGGPCPNRYGRGGNPAKREAQRFGMFSPPRSHLDELADVFIEEANRPLTKKTKVKTAMQAFARSMMHSGIRGESAAAHGGCFLALKWAYGHRDAAEAAWKADLVDEKAKRSADREGSAKLLPHHDNYFIDRDTGRAGIDGPLDQEQRLAEMGYLELRLAAADAMRAAQLALLEATSAEERDALWADLEDARAIFLHWNARVSLRERASLTEVYDSYPERAEAERREQLSEKPREDDF